MKVYPLDTVRSLAEPFLQERSCLSELLQVVWMRGREAASHFCTFALLLGRQASLVLQALHKIL